MQMKGIAINESVLSSSSLTNEEKDNNNKCPMTNIQLKPTSPPLNKITKKNIGINEEAFKQYMKELDYSKLSEIHGDLSDTQKKQLCHKLKDTGFNFKQMKSISNKSFMKYLNDGGEYKKLGEHLKAYNGIDEERTKELADKLLSKENYDYLQKHCSNVKRFNFFFTTFQ